MRLCLPLLPMLAVAAAAMFLRPPELDAVPLGGGDPCAAPVSWHVGDVDSRFGLSKATVRRAVQEATAVWEAAAGRPLFRHVPGHGMAVRLVWDERQADYARQRRETERARTLESRVDEARERARRLEARMVRARAIHESADTRKSTETYRASVRSYNRAVEDYNDVVGEYNDAIRELRRSGNVRVPAGDLEWETHSRNGRVVRVERTLTVRLVGSYPELVRVLAHELGHALGIGHLTPPDALMAERYRQQDVDRGLRLAPSDLNALQRLCSGHRSPDDSRP